MKIHEYQGKEILRRFGVPVPRGIACFSVDEAVDAARKLGTPRRIPSEPTPRCRSQIVWIVRVDNGSRRSAWSMTM